MHFSQIKSSTFENNQTPEMKRAQSSQESSVLQNESGTLEITRHTVMFKFVFHSQISSGLNKSIFKDRSSETAGILKKIVLENFLCHDRLEVKFNEKINFIIGNYLICN
jgi:hypothetical protein